MAALAEPCSSLLTLAATNSYSVLVQLELLLSRVATLRGQVILRTLLKRLQWHSK